jgi:hypothetical protein
MAVGRSHVFTLDDAALTGGAAIVSAGSGLPRRITPRMDYAGLVLSLAPSAFWRFDETAGNFLDRTAGARHLTPYVSAERGVAGPGLGGDLAVAFGSSSMGAFDATGSSPHGLVVGTPYSAFAKCRVACAGSGINHAIIGVGVSSQHYAGGTWLGWKLCNLSAIAGAVDTRLYVFYTAGVAGRIVYSNSFDAFPLLDGKWHSVGFTYNGGSITSAASFQLYVDGNPCSVMSNGATSTAVAAPEPVGAWAAIGASGSVYVQDAALWTGTALTAAQMKALAQPDCGRARWTLPADAVNARTLKGLEVPGSLSRNMPSSTDMRHGVRAYYDVGAGRVEFDPGDDLAVSVPAGTAVTLDLDFMHHDLADLPWVADSVGGGPVALYDEPDPPVVGVTVPGGARIAGTVRTRGAAQLVPIIVGRGA